MNDHFTALRRALPKPPAWRYDFGALQNLPRFGDWFAAMRKTPQNPVWHGEGDVWEHTARVCGELTAIPEFRALPDDARDALALATLLHDVGKIRRTRIEAGTPTSPGHAAAGAHMAREALWLDYGLCGAPEAQRFREAACLLIRHHSLPPRIVEREAPAREVLSLAADGALTPLFTMNALCLLAEADTRGRIAPDVDEWLDGVALAWQLARDEGCLDAPYPFPSPKTARALLSGARVWKDQALYDDSWGEVLLMCGLPGTGKDTWLQANHPEMPTVSLDDLRREMGVDPTDNQGAVVQAAKAKARAYLRSHTPFAWNATSLTPLRAEEIELFEAYRARVRVVYLETEWEENLRRNAGRDRRVPEDVIGRMLQKLEPPRRREAQSVEWICL